MLTLYLECVKTGTFPKKDLSMIDFISPYEEVAYQYLKESQPFSKLAWLVGLKLGHRNFDEIGNLAVNQIVKTKNVEVSFKLFRKL